MILLIALTFSLAFLALVGALLTRGGGEESRATIPHRRLTPPPFPHQGAKERARRLRQQRK